MEIRKPTEKEFEQVVIAANLMKLDTSGIRRGQFVCAFSECGLAGFVRINSQENFNELATLGVIKKYRKQGVSTLLVNFLKLQHSVIHLVTVIPAHFEKQGFKSLVNIPKELLSKFENCVLWHGYGDPVVMSWSRRKP